MSREKGSRRQPKGSFPRVSGDEPTLDELSEAGLLFSPRERG